MKMKRVSAVLAMLLGTVAAFGQVNGNFNNLNANGNVTNSHGTTIPSTITGDHGSGPRIQLSDGTGTAGNFATFDASGNIIDGGGFTPISWADVTGSRSFGVVYQNTSASAMYISGWGITSGSSVGGIDCAIGATSSPTSGVWSMTFTATISSGHAAFECMVPAGYYYTLIASNAVNGGVARWIEYVGYGGGTSSGGGTGPVTMSGDITGLSSGSRVSQLQGTTLNCSSPGTNFVPVVVGGNFVCGQLTQDQILPAFAITSFTCGQCGLVEIGTVITPSVNGVASYTSTPTSATVSDGLGGPITFNSPFTSWATNSPYTSPVALSVTFTLTAVGATTKTATQTLTWIARTFGGVGTASATGASGSGTTAVLSGATGTLSSAGLGNATTYGPYSPSSQKIYVLMLGASHTFKDQNGFTFAMNSPTSITFVNQFGKSVTMYLYESSSLLSANYTLTVVS